MTRVLTVKVASMGADHYALVLYGAGGGGKRTWSGSSMGLPEFTDLVAAWAGSADFVCVDETGLGGALVDLLAQRGIGVLKMHRMRSLEEALQ